MTSLRLIARSLVYYRRTAAVVVIGLAIAAAVIVGSLVIGDSIEGSIRHTALARLGDTADAITSPRFFRAELAEAAELPDPSATVIRLEGSAREQMSDAVIADVSIVGVDDRFFDLFPASTTTPPPRSALINESLASDAGVRRGDVLLVTVSRPGEAMADTLFARRDRAETLTTLRITVQEVLPDLGPGGFRLDPSTAMPRNVIVDREWLAGQIGEHDRANTVLTPSPLDSSAQARIARAMTLADHGLYLRRHGRWLSVFSDSAVLTDAQTDAAAAAATEFGDTSATSVYLADTIVASADPSRAIAYAVVADVPAADLPLREGMDRAQFGDDALILNAWAAEDLDAQVGERFTVTWRVSTPAGYEDRSTELTLAAIAEMRDLGADSDLVPDFAGITDAAHIDDWNPPFPVDLSRVTDRDDEYWERHRAAPKAFVSGDLLRRMWQGEVGDGPWITSVRIGPLADVADTRAEYERALLAQLAPEDAGIRFMPVREQALAASRGTSDFGQLFLGMSIFLVLAGAGLAGTLMRLSAERRASQAGIMLATGFTRRRSGRAIAGEGVALSLIGVAAGIPLGIGYAHAIVHVLATRWQGALGDAPVLGVYVEPVSVIIGAVAALVVGIGATWWGTRVLSGRPVLELLRGWQAWASDPSIGGRPWTAVATPLLLVAAGGIFIAARTGAIPAEGAFFGIGGALLIAALTGAHLVLLRAVARTGATGSQWAFALRAAASARGRSLLLMGLIAAATFVIVTVAANSRDFSGIDAHDRASGTGGFALIATSSVPLRFDPATEEGRENLGFLPEEQEALEGAEIISLPRSPGEDISCLNIAQTALPRLLGATDALIERGGFTFAATEEARGNPWTLLREDLPADAVPAVTDNASLQWQLHSAVGEVFDAGGDRPPLRFVGALSGSIFQSEIVVHAGALRAMYPEIEGPSYFLIDVPEGREEQVADALRSALGEMGVDVRSTREVLNRYITVQNTYLSMFMALGGLGLLLGTIGLVAVILRSAFERRGEFALMLATGFTRANLTRIVLVENAGLLLAGILVGTVTALIAVAPHLASAQAGVNWGALATVLLAVLAVGLVACAIGARATVRSDLIDALRTE